MKKLLALAVFCVFIASCSDSSNDSVPAVVDHLPVTQILPEPSESDVLPVSGAIYLCTFDCDDVPYEYSNSTLPYIELNKSVAEKIGLYDLTSLAEPYVYEDEDHKRTVDIQVIGDSNTLNADLDVSVYREEADGSCSIFSLNYIDYRPNSSTQTIYEFRYSDKPVTITGTETIVGKATPFTIVRKYDLKLSEGWNVIKITAHADGYYYNIKYTVSNLPYRGKWYSALSGYSSDCGSWSW